MNWIEVMAAGVGGAIGGGLGGLLLALLGDRAAGGRVRQAVRVAPVVLGGILGAHLLGPMASEAWADFQARTPAQRFDRALERTAVGSPEMKAWVERLKARGVTPEAALAEGRTLGFRGLARLSEEDLGRRTRILGKGMALVPVATCASIARGSGTKAELAQLLDGVGEEDALELAGVASRATLAELRQAPAAQPATTEADTMDLLRGIAERSGQAEVARVARLFEAGASDAEVCAGALVLYRAYPVTEPRRQARLALLIAGI